MRIITDSTCDLDFGFLEKKGVDVVKLNFFFGEEEYVDGESMTRDTFYSRLEMAEELPTTSQPSPAQFVEAYEKALEKGQDVLVLTISSELSGTYQSATIAKEMVESDKIHIVDTKAGTLSLGLLVLEAIRLEEDGYSAANAKVEMERLAEKTRLTAVVGTLKYLQMGGRLSKASATVGSILNVKPILQLIQGKIVAVGKARGKKASFEKVYELIKEQPIDENHEFVLGHSHQPELMEELLMFLKDRGVKVDHVTKLEIGTVIGVHVGPGAVGLAYIGK